MSTLKYLGGDGQVVRFDYVPWDKLNGWLSLLNGASWVPEELPPGLSISSVIVELENRRQKSRKGLKEGVVKMFVGERGYENDWREFENAQGYTHLEELIIYQPPDWRVQAREYFFTYRFDLGRKSVRETSDQNRTHQVPVEYEDDESGFFSAYIPILLISPVLVTLFHPEMSKTSRYEPLNLLLSYGVEEPIIESSLTYTPEVWKKIKREIWNELSPLNYFFAFQRNVELYDFDSLEKLGKKIGFPRLPLLCEFDFSKIIGQRLAKHLTRMNVVSWMKNHQTKQSGICPIRNPLSMIFCGPSGNGKTECAEDLAKLLNEPGKIDAFHKVDCGKIRDANELYGMSGAYYGSSQGSALNNYIVRMSNDPWAIGVVLLDEIEKAERSVIHGLYQVFDKGEWTNMKLEEGEGPQTSVISCQNVIFIMGSNAADTFIESRARAREEIYTAPTGHMRKIGDGQPLGSLAKSLEGSVRSELLMSYPFTDAFLGRIGCVVPFLPLSNGDFEKTPLLGEMITIAKYSIERDLDSLEKNSDMLNTAPTVSYSEKHKMTKVIVENAIPSAGVRSIQRCVKDELDDEILHDCLLKKGGISHDSVVKYRCDEPQKVITYQVKGKGNAADDSGERDSDLASDSQAVDGNVSS